MKKIWKNKPGASFWISFFFCLFLGILFYFGRKEQQLYQEFERRIRQEQQNQTEQTQIHSQQIQEEQPEQEPAEQNDIRQETRQMIRVLLMNSAQSSPFHEKVQVQSPNGLKIVRTEAPEQTVQEIPANTPADLGAAVEKFGPITVRSLEAGRMNLLTLERSQGAPSYEGTLEVSQNEEGFLLVNQVDLETYLKYVIPSEMPAGYPKEALKAQAVCARTYAIRQIKEGNLKNYGADVDDTVSYQVYNNIDRQPETDQAVDETAGMIMTLDGEPIQAYFFSTSCGYTSTDEVWETETPEEYLKSVSVSKEGVADSLTVEAVKNGQVAEKGKDRAKGFAEDAFRSFILNPHEQDYEREEPWYRWQITLPAEQIQKKCAAEIGKIREIQVVERSQGGAAKRLRILGDTGEQEIENEYRIREFLEAGETPVFLQDQSEAPSMKLLPSAYFVIDPVKEGERLTGFLIRGGGYGHGVGMSQNGARRLAEEGMDWRQILESFYQKITLAGQGET